MGRLGAIFRRYFSGNLGHLARARRGAMAVEYALLAVPFFTILFAIIETGYIFFAAILIEGATVEAVRQVRTGAVQQAGAPLPQFRGILCNNLFGVVPCGDLVIDVRNFTRFADANPPPIAGNAAGASFAPGAAGDVVVRVAYQWSFITPFIDEALSNADGGTRSIVSSAGVPKRTVLGVSRC